MCAAAGMRLTLHAFTGGSDGAVPDPNLIRDADGNPYGTTRYGGDLWGSVQDHALRSMTKSAGDRLVPVELECSVVGKAS
jgi:hypothetical protein